MDHGACNVIYVDKRAQDEVIRRDALSLSKAAQAGTSKTAPGYFDASASHYEDIYMSLEALLTVFEEVIVCSSGTSCLANLTRVQEGGVKDSPIVVLVDVPYDDEQRLRQRALEIRTPSPTSTRRTQSEATNPDELYGTTLLAHITSPEMQHCNKLVVPIVILSGSEHEANAHDLPSPSLHLSQILADPGRLMRYLDDGAVDVLASPLRKEHIHTLAVHAYRVHKDVVRNNTQLRVTKQNRKISWVGVNEAKPFAYLREAMVSGLMNNICNPDTVWDAHESSDLEVDPARQAVVAKAVGAWSFCAHDFTDDELLFGALTMIQHALSMPELEKWRMDTDELTVFLLASRHAYNDFVLYHNFRHVVDVLQALFFSLVQIGALPPYPSNVQQQQYKDTSPPIAALLEPFEALTLLVAAIGHDVGHPGVNNAFLVALNAPLAQLYNDRSVLESFHCAAYSQILRRYWPSAFQDAKMRRLMITSILATDMGLHFKYMLDTGNLQEKLAHPNSQIEAWNAKVREENRDLLCGLLIKCADISNVARKFDVAKQWADILTDEFSNQGVMEQELEMSSCLFGGPPVRGDMIKLGESQIGFMNIFACPLFEAVTDILPAMQFAVKELINNKSVWEKRNEQEKAKASRKSMRLGPSLLSASFVPDATPSPFSQPNSNPFDVIPPVPSASKARPLAETKDLRSDSASGPIDSAHPAITPTRLSAEGRRSTSSQPRYAVITESRRSSAAGLENQSTSRRGSADASLTTILVTENGSDDKEKLREKDEQSKLRSMSPTKQWQAPMAAKSSPQKSPSIKPAADQREVVRPLTAPDSTSHRMHSYPEVQLPPPVPTKANGSFDAPSPNRPLSQYSSKTGSDTVSSGDPLQSSPQSWNSNAHRANDRVQGGHVLNFRRSATPLRPAADGVGEAEDKNRFITAVRSNASLNQPQSTGTDGPGRPKSRLFSGNFWKKFKGPNSKMASRGAPQSTSKEQSLKDRDLSMVQEGL